MLVPIANNSILLTQDRCRTTIFRSVAPDRIPRLLTRVNVNLNPNLSPENYSKEKSQAFLLGSRPREKNYCNGASSDGPAKRSNSILYSECRFFAVLQTRLDKLRVSGRETNSGMDLLTAVLKTAIPYEETYENGNKAVRR